MAILEDFNTELSAGTLTFARLCEFINCARSGDEKHVMLLSYFLVNYGGNAARDASGNVVQGTPMIVTDFNDQATPPLAIYSSLRIVPATGVVYQGQTFTGPFNIIADQGRFTPALAGLVTGNYTWAGAR